MTDRIFRIVMVEDNPCDVYLMRIALENAGLCFELTVIEDGAAAFAFIEGKKPYTDHPTPDLTVLDLNLPKSSGIEILEAMRQQGHLANVPVVVMSSSESAGEQAKVKALGVKKFITKPHDLEKFFQIGIVLKEMLTAVPLQLGAAR